MISNKTFTNVAPIALVARRARRGNLASGSSGEAEVPKTNSGTTTAITALLALLVAGSAMAQNESHKPSDSDQPRAAFQSSLNSTTSPERVKDLLFVAIVASCPVAESPSPDLFYYKKGTLYQVRRAWTRLYPEALTEADKLNGIQYKGLAALGAPLYRHITYTEHHSSGPWEWTPWADASKLIPTATEMLSGSHAKSLSSLVEAINMVKKDNRWSFSIAWEVFDTDIDPDVLNATKRPCSVATSARPFAPEEDRQRGSK
ncbi:MAG: hypothetical protein M3O35_20755 [Acidobacteriota bacterium]|nr:hypothetical protein [Acidobacteriota bacterium]